MVASARSSMEISFPSKRYQNYCYDTDRKSMNGSPDKMNIWVDRKTTRANSGSDGKVDVVYYISKNGDLQHPHFIEVFLSSVHGLYLKDVRNRLNTLRGDGMSNTYSWSSKRSYKNGYVWQDLSENDLIHPTNGKDEYILKGSEILPSSSSSFRSSEIASSRNIPELKDSVAVDASIPPANPRPRRNMSWSSFDNPHDHKIHKCESSRGFAGAGVISGIGTGGRRVEHESVIVELSREEILSPPVSNCSSEVLVGTSGIIDVDRDYGTGDRTAKPLSGTMKVSKVLMQLISCGSASMKDLRSMRSRGV